MSDFDDGGKAWPFGDKRANQIEMMKRNKSPLERREALLAEKRASSCTGGLPCSANPLDKEDGYATDEVIEWAAWIDHTEGTEVCADERSICIAHAILEAVELYEQNAGGEH